MLTVNHGILKKVVVINRGVNIIDMQNIFNKSEGIDMYGYPVSL